MDKKWRPEVDEREIDNILCHAIGTACRNVRCQDCICSSNKEEIAEFLRSVADAVAPNGN